MIEHSENTFDDEDYDFFIFLFIFKNVFENERRFHCSKSYQVLTTPRLQLAYDLFITGYGTQQSLFDAGIS